MADFAEMLKNALGRSAKFIGRTANTATQATKFKVNELSTLNKRRDLIAELGAKIFELCSNGVELPAEAAALVEQIKKLDGELAVLRADHAAQKAAAAEQQAMEKAARATEKAAAKAAAAIEQSTTPVEVEMPEVDAPAEEAEIPTLDVEAEKEAEAADEEVPTLNV